MGQYFKAYSPARHAIAALEYPQNYDQSHLRNIPAYSPEEISEMFDFVEASMGAEFGEYVFVGDYGTLIYRTGDEASPSFSVENDTSGLTELVWFED
jgi:hypothetical protein